MFHNLDPQIVSAALGLAGTIFTALLRFAILSRKRLLEKLTTAQADIAYLLAVEEAHCAKHRELSRASFKLRVRKEVTGQGLTWSGRFTPGRVRAGRNSSTTLATSVSARLIVLKKVLLRAAGDRIDNATKHVRRWCNVATKRIDDGKELAGARLASNENA